MDRKIGEGILEVKRRGLQKNQYQQYQTQIKKIRIKVDTLDYATGGVLSMECEDRWWRPETFLSKSLNKTEKNYKIYKKEMLVVIRGLENWRYLLESAKFKFKV